MTELKQMAALIKNLSGLEGILAGGCVRDALLGETPKDYDYLVYIDQETPQEENWFDELIVTIEDKGVIINRVLGESSFNSANADTEDNKFKDRFSKGITFSILGKHVDLLFCVEPIRETIEKFDCNFNKVFYNEPYGIVGKIPDELVFAPWVSEERKDYITSKFNKYKNIENFRQH